MSRFPDSEFEAASHRTLTAEELERADSHRRAYLDAARDALAFPIRITSFVRILSATHGAGYSLDIQPCRICGGVQISEATFQRRLEALFQWIGINRPQSFGVLIHERNHLHVTLAGFQNRTGVVYREPVEGEYVLTSLRPIITIAPIVLALGVLVYVAHNG